jgi:hypothetical protein
MKSRTPSDFAIVAIFQDKRKPQNAVPSAFPPDFMGISGRYGDASRLLQAGAGEPAPTSACKAFVRHVSKQRKSCIES